MTWRCSAAWLWLGTRRSSILPASSSSSGGEGGWEHCWCWGRAQCAALCVHKLIRNLPGKNLLLCLILLLKESSKPSLLCCLEASLPTEASSSPFLACLSLCNKVSRSPEG